METFCDKDFKDLKEIARGGFGKVYIAYCQDYGEVAIKTIELENLDDSFEREMAIVSTLNHPNITRYYGFYNGDKGRSIVMEYAKNGNLYDFLEKCRDEDIDLPIELRYQICLGICRGIKSIHKKDIVHRDLKTPNILLNGNMKPLITDFGQSKRDKRNLTTLNNSHGTYKWKAPETYDGKFTKKSDIFSLGIILWEIITMEELFKDMVDHQIFDFVKYQNRRPEFPGDFPMFLKNIIMKCWDENPDNRPDISNVLDFIERMIQNRDVSTGILFELVAIGDIDGFNSMIGSIDVNMRYPDKVYDGQEMKNATLLHFAARYGQIHVVQKLIQLNALVDATDSDDWTPLHYAADQNHLNVVISLISKLPNVNVLNLEKNTPLFLATKNGNYEIVDQLLRKGAKADIKNCDQMTPIHIAAQNNHLMILKKLVKRNKALLNEQDFYGNTPMHYAAEAGNLLIVQELVKNLGLHEELNQFEETPMDLAENNNHQEIVSFLASIGQNKPKKPKMNPPKVVNNGVFFEVRISNLGEGTTQDQLIELFSSASFPVEVLPLNNQSDVAYIRLSTENHRNLIMREFNKKVFNFQEMIMKKVKNKKPGAKKHYNKK